jgi:hypothetical protein
MRPVILLPAAKEVAAEVVVGPEAGLRWFKKPAAGLAGSIIDR